MKKINYNKLIRDGIVDRLERLGLEFEVEKLNDADFEKALFDKVAEEAKGVVNAEDKQELTEELADLYIVLEEIKKLKGISESELQNVLKENIEDKGAFDERFLLLWTEDNGYRSNEK